MRRVRVRQPVLLLVVLIAVLLRDTSGLARMALLASLLHESGHVLAYRLLLKRFPVLNLAPWGIGLRWHSGLEGSPRCLFCVAAAGPAVNLLLCAALLGLMQLRAGYWGYCFAGVNLCTGLFNLLPVGSLDGARILTALRAGRR